MKRVFSGIQPTGNVHIGNYIGALANWVALQKEYHCTYCVVNLHAITVPQKPQALSSQTLSTAALCLAAGVNPEKSILFVQSDVPEHAELAWILNCFTYTGELKRMTQFKEKSSEAQETTTVGLYDYPVLMAADVLAHRAHAVPVGEDQTQHLELVRTIARRFNNLYGEVFPVPDAVLSEQGARIMGLDDPSVKMSKSAASDYNYIALSDPPEKIRKKLQSAVTDSGREIRFDERQKPAISNLLTIFSQVTGKTIPHLEAEYDGRGYAQFKKDLAEVVVDKLTPIQGEMRRWSSDGAPIQKILKEGAQKARQNAAATLKEVKSRIGL